MNAYIKHIDFSQAYSHADICEICYAIPPDDFKSIERPSGIWKVRKALYGSPQAGRRWYNHISRFLRKVGYSQSTVDACVFFIRNWANSFPPPFVNDLREEQHGNLVRRLQEARFRLTDKGDVEVFCGMQFERIVGSPTLSPQQRLAQIKTLSQLTLHLP
eukprot:g28799.t1